jgi:hypothetical protein
VRRSFAEWTDPPPARDAANNLRALLVVDPSGSTAFRDAAAILISAVLTPGSAS